MDAFQLRLRHSGGDYEQLDWRNSERESYHDLKSEKQYMINGLDVKVMELMDAVDGEESGGLTARLPGPL